MALITIKNITDKQVVIYAADGDSIIVQPKAVVTCSDAMLWCFPDHACRIISRSDNGEHHRVLTTPKVSCTSYPVATPEPSTTKKNTTDGLSAALAFKAANPSQ